MTIPKQLKLGALVLTSAVVFAACQSQTPSATDESSVENSETEVMMDAENEQAMEQSNTIVDVASSSEDFSTLVTAVQAADLVETLQSDGPFTVFAPTNDAFSKLPAGTVDTLLMPENKDQLASVLTYHVVAGKTMASDLSHGMKITTVQGQQLTVEITGDAVMLVDANGSKATVTQTDLQASNGVVHVIDSVVLPKN